MRRAVAVVLLGVALLATARTISAQTGVRVRVEPRTIPLGGTADLVLEARSTGLRGAPARPDLPAIEGVEVVARARESRIELDGTQVTRAWIYRYTLRPRRTGTIEIGPVSVPLTDRVLRTRPVRLAVVGPGGEDRDRAAGTPSLFAVARIDRSRAWVGQQVTLTFAFYHDPRVRLHRSPDYDPPETPGFWRIELDESPRIGEERIGDRRYRVQRFRYALFPIQPGRHTIGPAAVRIVQADPGRWWTAGRHRTIRTDSLALYVDSLPAGAPAGFAGAIGSYRLSGGARRDRSTADTAVELEVTVRGTGNPSAIPPPVLPSWPEVAIRAPTVDVETSHRDPAVVGRKTFRWQIVPGRAGTLDLGTARLPYFDPATDAYAVDTLRLGEIRIDPSPHQPVRLASTEVGGPTLWDPREPRDSWPRGLVGSPIAWAALVGPWLAWLGVGTLRRRPAGSGARRRDLLARLAASRTAVSAGEPGAFGRADALVREVIRAYAEASGEKSSDPVLQAAREARREIAVARFAEHAEAEVDASLARLEKEIHGRRRSWLRAIPLLLLPLSLAALAAVAGTTTPGAEWAAANRAYRSGDFRAAAAGYSALLEDHDDPGLAANLAAARWRTGDRGGAVAAYLRGLQLDPRHPRLREDLAELRREMGNPPTGPAPAVPGLDRVRLDELFLALLLANGLAFAVVLGGRGRRWPGLVGVLLVAASATLVGLRAHFPERPLGVALTTVPVSAGTSAEAIGRVPEGAVVELLERGGARWRIRAEGTPAGWVAADRIAPLD